MRGRGTKRSSGRKRDFVVTLDCCGYFSDLAGLPQRVFFLIRLN